MFVVYMLITFFLSAGTLKTEVESVRSCHHEGRVYHLGQKWVANDGCSTCTCDNSAPDIHCLHNNCHNSVYTYSPGDVIPVCTYGLNYYLVGQVFNATDGCNKCLCTERGMQCTQKACNASGFATAHERPLFGECHYHGSWYHFHDQWQAGDGCNTCTCVGIGNYQGPYQCTTSPCCKSSSLVVG